MIKPKVKPEGREGIFLIEPDEAVKFLKSLGFDQIHNFVDLPGIMLGADWELQSVIDLCKKPGVGIAIVVEPNFTMRHHFVVADYNANERKAFDVGEISERDLEIVGGGLNDHRRT